MIGRSNLLVRKAITNFVRNHSHGGIPGEIECFFVALLTFFSKWSAGYALCYWDLKTVFSASQDYKHSGNQTGCYTIQNLPFDINNRFKLTAMFVVFFGSGFASPFLILRHQLLKK